MDGQVESLTIPAQELLSTPIEQQIQASERDLGIQSENDRQLEASLFIDKKFLNYALITGVSTQPERIFGDKAWADYLDGRLFARNYGQNDLTPEFIQELHKKLTQRSDPRVSGKIRDIGVIGASYDEVGKAVTYTQEQVNAVEQNPQLGFKRVPQDDENSTTGFIIYPHPKSGVETQEAIGKDLRELCEWFNSAKKQETYNPHIVAGLLQHRLISLHPFLDSNGRLTRVLMNWSLENDGEAPSVIDNPGEDILTDEETWISYITEGSRQYEAIKARQAALEEAGIDNVNALFDLGQDRAFYEYIFRHLRQAPPIPTNGDKHKHETYEKFLAEFKAEMNRFQEYMRLTSSLETSGGKREITQGGLITPEFMQFATSDTAQVLPLELREQFFTDTEVYRGGMVMGEVDDQTLCQMFQRYTAVGTGYRSLRNAHLSATSMQGVNPQSIRESMDYYNKMFASAYLQKKHPDVENPYGTSQSSVGELNRTIQEHVAGGESIWNSPFASTSLDYTVGRAWARNFDRTYAQDARFGVLFKSQLPREGMAMTFGKKIQGVTAKGLDSEYEALVAGGLQPASITGVEAYERGSANGNPALTAKRVEADGSFKVVIEDRRGEFVVRRTYGYSTGSVRFELQEEALTDILSTVPIEQPSLFRKDDYMWLQDMMGDMQKDYTSPFKDKGMNSSLESYKINYDLDTIMKYEKNEFNKSGKKSDFSEEAYNFLSKEIQFPSQLSPEKIISSNTPYKKISTNEISYEDKHVLEKLSNNKYDK